MGFVNPEIANLGIDPISPSAPAGGPVSYDPQFEQLSAEIAKIGSLTGAVVDWDAVVQLSRSLLKSKAKDLRIAAYEVLNEPNLPSEWGTGPDPAAIG